MKHNITFLSQAGLVASIFEWGYVGLHEFIFEDFEVTEVKHMIWEKENMPGKVQIHENKDFIVSHLNKSDLLQLLFGFSITGWKLDNYNKLQLQSQSITITQQTVVFTNLHGSHLIALCSSSSLRGFNMTKLLTIFLCKF